MKDELRDLLRSGSETIAEALLRQADALATAVRGVEQAGRDEVKAERVRVDEEFDDVRAALQKIAHLLASLTERVDEIDRRLTDVEKARSSEPRSKAGAARTSQALELAHSLGIEINARDDMDFLARALELSVEKLRARSAAGSTGKRSKAHAGDRAVQGGVTGGKQATIGPGRVKHIRMERGMTPQELAESAGLRADLVLDLDAGKRKRIKADEARKLADALGVAVDDLKGRN